MSPDGQSTDDQSAYKASLSFIDILYAVPVADLATRVSRTQLHMSTSAWTNVLLALLAITFGWIGHHTNRQRMPEAMAKERSEKETPFWGARFAQFGAEVGIIGAYFALGTRAGLSAPVDPGASASVALWKAKWLLAIFGLYLAWDALDVMVATKLQPATPDAELTRWITRASLGGAVTFAFVCWFGLTLAVVREVPTAAGSIVTFNVTAMIALYAYRLIQKWVIDPLDHSPSEQGGVGERLRARWEQTKPVLPWLAICVVATGILALAVFIQGVDMPA